MKSPEPIAVITELVVEKDAQGRPKLKAVRASIPREDIINMLFSLKDLANRLAVRYEADRRHNGDEDLVTIFEDEQQTA